MKINEQGNLPFSTQNLTGYSNNQRDETEFEHLIHTPSGSNTGDEYYWQHQGQLQKSSLRFEQHILEAKPQKSPFAKDTLVCDSHLLFPHSDENQLLVITTDEASALTNKVENCLLSRPEDYSSHIKEQDQQSIAMMTSQAQPQTVESLKTIEAHAIQSRISQTIVKNHHLFIENDEVELSLNTQELNRLEEQELREMIHLNLKHKGLSLKQLIINGVKK
ncbi:hypothetical protein [uncultured Legionella sp.]|uniref:hypothetical protein n=1 Tax=uncultured Legionella sp. TaxID=210934 RepID=UPI0026146554|nr:hypothetical protein [uncultured Legionella sp.]